MTSERGERGPYRKLSSDERLAFRLVASSAGLEAACRQFGVSKPTGKRIMGYVPVRKLPPRPLTDSERAANPVQRAVSAVLVPRTKPPAVPPLPGVLPTNSRRAPDFQTTETLGSPIVRVSYTQLGEAVCQEMHALIPLLRSDEGCRKAFLALVRAQAVTAEIVLTLHELGIALETTGPPPQASDTVEAQGQEVTD